MLDWYKREDLPDGHLDTILERSLVVVEFEDAFGESHCR